MYDAGPQAVEAVRALRVLAQERPQELELFEGFTDAELDGWAVAVPEDVRVVLREIGGLETADHEYRFGPRGRETFADGCWTLGETDFGEGSLITGVGAAGWGPVVAVNPWGPIRMSPSRPRTLPPGSPGSPSGSPWGWRTGRGEVLRPGHPHRRTRRAGRGGRPRTRSARSARRRL